MKTFTESEWPTEKIFMKGIYYRSIPMKTNIFSLFTFHDAFYPLPHNYDWYQFAVLLHPGCPRKIMRSNRDLDSKLLKVLIVLLILLHSLHHNIRSLFAILLTPLYVELLI